ncbi:hypothetical protein HBB16_03300 [Pseudonocardia sp. MCCB 268]|nr:hypothetical protein [Pseudonocardia cytotoxica]
MQLLTSGGATVAISQVDVAADIATSVTRQAPLAHRPGSTTTSPTLVVRRDSRFRTLDDLRGARVSIGPAGSGLADRCGCWRSPGSGRTGSGTRRARPASATPSLRLRARTGSTRSSGPAGPDRRHPRRWQPSCPSGCWTSVPCWAGCGNGSPSTRWAPSA